VSPVKTAIQERMVKTVKTVHQDRMELQEKTGLMVKTARMEEMVCPASQGYPALRVRTARMEKMEKMEKMV
jgi:hypothetical protein